MNTQRSFQPIGFDRRTQDIGNIVEFGHVNVRVPDQQQAMAFYVVGLGLTRDPYVMTGVDNAWVNVGTCQFHLPVGPAQVLRGVIGLVMPDLQALLARLTKVQTLLQHTEFAFADAGTHVDVTCPWGNRLRIHAPDETRFGRTVLGMPYVQIDVARGTTPGIARFYQQVLAAKPQLGDDADGRFVCVAAGLCESMVFRETARPLPSYDGHHVQIAVADFSGVHQRLLDRDLVTEESNESQYRFENIIDLDTGEPLATIEHEVRSMRHPMYARRLVNRDPAISNNRYAPGHEAAMWQLPPG